LYETAANSFFGTAFLVIDTGTVILPIWHELNRPVWARSLFSPLAIVSLENVEDSFGCTETDLPDLGVGERYGHEISPFGRNDRGEVELTGRNKMARRGRTVGEGNKMARRERTVGEGQACHLDRQGEISSYPEERERTTHHPDSSTRKSRPKSA
jgi:hypothetical protein